MVQLQLQSSNDAMGTLDYRVAKLARQQAWPVLTAFGHAVE